jgi:hypothetical protein
MYVVVQVQQLKTTPHGFIRLVKIVQQLKHWRLAHVMADNRYIIASTDCYRRYRTLFQLGVTSYRSAFPTLSVLCLIHKALQLFV